MKLLQKYTFLILIVIFIGVQNICAEVVANDGRKYTNESVLNTSGTWIKLKVEENAIYKLTYEDIKKMGIENPSKAKIYGYGGWILDEDFRTPYIDDLPEVTCWISGNNETLDNNEYLLFYGKGTVKWTYNVARKEYVHENNPYSTYGVYFLTDATPGEPKRMSSKEFTVSNANALTYFEDYMVHEKEEYSIAKIGRELYGESFSGRNIQDFQFKIPGVLNEKNGSLSLSFVSESTEEHTLTLSINDAAGNFVDYGSISISAPSVSAGVKGIHREMRITNWGKDLNKNENTLVRIDFPCGVRAAHLNYIRLNMQRKLQYYNTGYTFFRNSENLTQNVKYEIQNANKDLLVFDITDNYNYNAESGKYEKNNVQLITTTFNESAKTLSFYSESGILREYVLVDPKQNFITPQSLGKIESQNLHGSEQVEMVIISPKSYTLEAERLAQKHKEHSGLKVAVVNPEQIYNEFSSGTPDASAYRRFMKMFYDRAVTNNNLKPKYLLLFGDGIYDNRFIDFDCKNKGFNKDNFLLTYQVKESLSVNSSNVSYSGDDYFGFLDETEDKNFDNCNKKLMLGIGRFPVQDLASAKIAVNKTILYMENKDYRGYDNRGIWKNSIVFLADDADDSNPGTYYNLSTGKGNSHIVDADDIAEDIKKYSEYMVTKVYMDAFKPEASGGRKTFDNSAKVILKKAINDGCLIVNYTGHGSTKGIADNILNFFDVQTMDIKHLPLWITATCDFSWFDGLSVSIGEQVFLNEKGGGIALFSATRPVYADGNKSLNDELMNNLLSKREDGSRMALGDVIREGKNAQIGLPQNYNKMCYILIGDPALKLNNPEPQIEVDKFTINGEEISANNNDVIDLKALDEVVVSGFIKENKAIKTDFNGELTANIFDGMQTIQSISKSNPENRPRYNSGEIYHFHFTDYPNKISQIHSKVENGKFEFSFVVMSDITNIESVGKMNFYAYDSSNTSSEVSGSFMNYHLYGVNEDADIGSTLSPEIRKMYLNEESFKSGDIVNETPFFVAEIKDSLGINISGAGMGHNLKIFIDNSKEYVLNDYFIASKKEENAGIVKFNIPALSEGEHTLKLQVWNALNNVTIETINFTVEKGLKPELYDLRVNPNPLLAGTEAKFVFEHNRPNTQLDVTIAVFDMSGRPIWSHQEIGSSGLTELLEKESLEVSWDLKTNSGSNVQPGIYLYSATIKSKESTETTKAKKMIVVGQ